MDVIYLVKVNGEYIKNSAGSPKTYQSRYNAETFNERFAKAGKHVAIYEYKYVKIHELPTKEAK